MVSDFLQLAETVAAVHTNATFCLGTTGANQSKTPIPSNKVLRHSIDVYQTKHAIGWNSSHDLFQPIACFVWYTSTLCCSTLLAFLKSKMNQMKDMKKIYEICITIHRKSGSEEWCNDYYSICSIQQYAGPPLHIVQ